MSDSANRSGSEDSNGIRRSARNKRKQPSKLQQVLPLALSEKNGASGSKSAVKNGSGARAAASFGTFGSVRAGAKITEGTPLKLTNVRKTPVDFGDGTERSVPTFLIDAFAHINREGLQVEGIFRREGNAKRVRAVWGPLHGYVGIPELCNVHDTCCMIKRFFRDIREPLLTRSLQRQFVLSAQTIKHESTKVRCLLDLVQVLPQSHKDTLGYLMRQLKMITTHSSENRMDAHALATVLAPTIFRGDDVSGSTATATQNKSTHGNVTQNQVAAQAFMKSTGELLKAKIEVIELLIVHADELAVLTDVEKVMSPSGFEGICPGEPGNNFDWKPSREDKRRARSHVGSASMRVALQRGRAPGSPVQCTPLSKRIAEQGDPAPMPMESAAARRSRSSAGRFFASVVQKATNAAKGKHRGQPAQALLESSSHLDERPANDPPPRKSPRIDAPHRVRFDSVLDDLARVQDARRKRHNSHCGTPDTQGDTSGPVTRLHFEYESPRPPSADDAGAEQSQASSWLQSDLSHPTAACGTPLGNELQVSRTTAGDVSVVVNTDSANTSCDENNSDGLAAQAVSSRGSTVDADRPCSATESGSVTATSGAAPTGASSASAKKRSKRRHTAPVHIGAANLRRMRPNTIRNGLSYRATQNANGVRVREANVGSPLCESPDADKSADEVFSHENVRRESQNNTQNTPLLENLSLSRGARNNSGGRALRHRHTITIDGQILSPRNAAKLGTGPSKRNEAPKVPRAVASDSACSNGHKVVSKSVSDMPSVSVQIVHSSSDVVKEMVDRDPAIKQKFGTDNVAVVLEEKSPVKTKPSPVKSDFLAVPELPGPVPGAASPSEAFAHSEKALQALESCQDPTEQMNAVAEITGEKASVAVRPSVAFIQASRRGMVKNAIQMFEHTETSARRATLMPPAGVSRLTRPTLASRAKQRSRALLMHQLAENPDETVQSTGSPRQRRLSSAKPATPAVLAARRTLKRLSSGGANSPRTPRASTSRYSSVSSAVAGSAFRAKYPKSPRFPTVVQPAAKLKVSPRRRDGQNDSVV